MTPNQADRDAAAAIFDVVLGDVGSYAEFGYPSYREGAIRSLTNAFAAHRRAALEEAIKACDDQRDDFLSEQYAVGQPMSSFSERFACGECARAIRALIDKEPT